MKIQTFILCGFLFGCISTSHLGIRQWDKCQLTCRTLNKKTALACEPFEKEVISTILSSNTASLRIFFSPKFNRNITSAELAEIQLKVASYGFTGKSFYGKFVRRTYSLDEASKWDGFQAFDFISSTHVLKGKKDGNLILCFRRKHEKFELVGMSLCPNSNLNSNASNSFKFLYLENVEGEESIFCPCIVLLS